MIFQFFISGDEDLEKTLITSSHQLEKNNKFNDVRIKISESIKETKTLSIPDVNNFEREKVKMKNSEPMISTKLSSLLSSLENSSYVEKNQNEIPVETKSNEFHFSQVRPEPENVSNDEKTTTRSKVFKKSDNYYDAIKPTKTVKFENVKISPTDIKNDKKVAGEGRGVSMRQSGPQKSNVESTSYKRIKRGFGNSLKENLNDEEKENVTNNHRNERKKKLEGKNAVGKNYNQIAETLEKIAKVTVDDANKEPASETVVVSPGNFRESRDEENRKASPDIQDIITGIVNILNGKTPKPSDGHKVRPVRPAGTRINNRGPPRISDVPPLDFDGPYRPLPPPKRIPPPPPPLHPPYPFDVPPSMPNIPLPPQPHKPGIFKLPSHPFIEGVPIPERVVPNAPTKIPPPLISLPSDQVHLEYDTISMSEPFDKKDVPIIELQPENPLATTEATTFTLKTETKPPLRFEFDDSTKSFNITITTPSSPSSSGKPETSKIKSGTQKLGGISANKNSNKRIKPNLTPNSQIDKNQNKTLPALKVDRDKVKTTTTESVTGFPDKIIIITDVTPLKENNVTINTTNDDDVATLIKKESEDNQTMAEGINESDDFFKPTFNISAIFNTEQQQQQPITTTTTTTTTMATPEIEKNNKTQEIIISEPANNVTTYDVPSSSTTIESISPTEIESKSNKTDFLELSILHDEPLFGIGEATPVLESSFPELSPQQTEPQSSATATTALPSIKPTQPIITGNVHTHTRTRTPISYFLSITLTNKSKRKFINRLIIPCRGRQKFSHRCKNLDLYKRAGTTTTTITISPLVSRFQMIIIIIIKT